MILALMWESNFSMLSESFILVFQLLLMLMVLSLSSLLTVIESKGLASSQSSLGPSYNGWFGLIQMVQDGIKFICKDYQMGEYNSNSMVLAISCMFHFMFSYSLFLFISLDYMLYSNVSFLFMMCLIVLMMNHITVIMCGFIIQHSFWTLLSCISLILLYFMYDIMFILILLFLSSSTNLVYTFHYYNMSDFLESQYSTMNMSKYPMLFVLFLFLVFMEAGRIPVDLLESESELISGYTIEYPGFLYALYASAEYSIILFHAVSISFLFLFHPYLSSSLLTLIMFLFVIISSTLPSFKLNQLFFLSIHYLFPNIIYVFGFFSLFSLFGLSSFFSISIIGMMVLLLSSLWAVSV